MKFGQNKWLNGQNKSKFGQNDWRVGKNGWVKDDRKPVKKGSLPSKAHQKRVSNEYLASIQAEKIG